MLLAAWAGLMYLVWIYVFHEKPFATFGLFDIFSLSVLLIGFPLAYVGHYAGLRYKLSRTRWRGIRCGMAGSAWRYGVIATFLHFANTMTAYLLTPVVSVNLARPRIANARLGTLPLRLRRQRRRHLRPLPRLLLPEHRGLDRGRSSRSSRRSPAARSRARHHLRRIPEAVHAAQPAHRLCWSLAIAFGAYIVFGLLILPLRCWWQAYLLRYLVTAQPRRQRAVRHRDLDAADVGLPGAELPDRAC